MWKHTVYTYDQSKPYISTSNEYLEKEYIEDLDWVQLIEDFFHPLSSHTDVPYDLEQFGAYTQSYQ